VLAVSAWLVPGSLRSYVGFSAELDCLADWHCSLVVIPEDQALRTIAGGR
jgi:hypothetical protein